MIDQPPDKVLRPQSDFDPQGEPFVQLLLNTEVIAQLSAGSARDIALDLLKAAEWVEQDAFILDWAVNRRGSGKQEAAGMLADFRAYRVQRAGSKREGKAPQ